MRYFIIQFIACLFIFSSPSHAKLAQDENIKYWQLYDSANYSLEQIIGTPNSAWEEIPKGHTNSKGLDKNYWKASQGQTLWIKIKLPRIVDSDRIWIELAPNVGLDGKMAIYKNGIWSWQQAVGRHGSDYKNFPASFLTFAIDNPRDHRIAFFKINSSQILHFSINVRDDDSQVSLLASRNLMFGLMFGLMLLAIIYNMVIGISANERLYIYYATYVLCIALYMIAMTGYTRVAFPEWGGNGSFSNLSVLLTIFTATIFVRELLETKKTIPQLDILLRAQSVALFVSIFLLGFASDLVAYACAEAIGIISPIILFVSGLGALRKKHPMAKFFLIAWSSYIFSGWMWAWMWLGYVAPSHETLYVFLAGSVTEIIMLSLLLGYRYSDLKRKTETLSQSSNNFENISNHDPLTGLYNRQGLYLQIERILKTSEKDLIWIDINIDNFSEFNNKHGIHVGDLLLNEYGQLLQTKVRRDNLAAKLIDKENSFGYRRGVAGRVGGGQFTILLSNCSLPQARLYVERLMRDIELIKIKSSDSSWISASVSIGVIHILPKEEFHSAWLRANKKLSLAKSQGCGQLAFS